LVLIFFNSIYKLFLKQLHPHTFSRTLQHFSFSTNVGIQWNTLTFFHFKFNIFHDRFWSVSCAIITLRNRTSLFYTITIQNIVTPSCYYILNDNKIPMYNWIFSNEYILHYTNCQCSICLGLYNKYYYY